MSLVSVLLPYRNCGATLENAIRSILTQAGVNLELIAIDDGSTDGGPALVANIARADARMVPVATGHLAKAPDHEGVQARSVGIARALAYGLEVANGNLIARMDGDDISLPGRLRAQVAYLHAHPAVGAVGTRVSGFPESAIQGGLRAYIDWQNSLLTCEDHARELFVESPLCHPSVLIRRAAIAAVGGFVEQAWAEDYDLWLRLAARGFGLAKVPDVLFLWRHGGGRLTFTNPIYALERFREAKAHYLAPRLTRLRDEGRPFAVWGAGPTGKRFARALEPHGLRASLFIDIDPRKLGRTARGAPIVAASALESQNPFVLVAVGSAHARGMVRRELVARGRIEGPDFLCVA